MENKKNAKKIIFNILKVFIFIILVLFILCGAFAIWQWDNIQAFMLSRKYSSSELLSQLSENDRHLKDEVAKYFPNGIRDFTEEEKALIASGAVTEKQLLAKIIAEQRGYLFSESIYNKILADQKKANSKAEITFGENDILVPKPAGEKTDDSSLVIVGKPSEESPVQEQNNPNSADAIISKYIAQLYTLEGKYIGAIESVVASAKSDAKAKGLTKKDTSQLLSVGANYTNTINALESRCDGEVEAIITSLTAELNAIGADTSIISTIRAAYKNEKELKRAYYMNMVYA